MKFTKNENNFNIEVGKVLNIYGGKKPPYQARQLAIDLFAFGFRVRWYPLDRYFNIQNTRKWASNFVEI